ncbi:MAG: hypothetical protein WHS44_01190 [Fimbriimonadales bacterium]|nr:MAG: hypothetical protein KatS3mg018_0709 [Fimbriimonadales bacterium]
MKSLSLVWGLLMTIAGMGIASAQPALDVLWKRSVPTTNITNFVFSPLGSLAAFSGEGTLFLYDLPLRKVARELNLSTSSTIRQIVFSADGAQLGVTTGAEIVLYDVFGDTVSWTRSLPADTSLSIAFSPDNRWVAIGSSTLHRVYLLRRSDGAVVQEWSGHTGAVSSVHFTPDSQRVVSTAQDGYVRIWRIDSPTPENEYLIGGAGSQRVSALAPDGQILAIGGFDDNTVRLIELASGQPTATLQLTNRAIFVAFSPDGQHLAACTASMYNSVYLWRLSDLQQRFPPHPPDAREITNTRLLAFSPDGQFWVEAGADTRLPVRLVDTGEWVDSLIPFRGETPVPRFSPDSQTLYAASARFGWLYQWDARTGNPSRATFREILPVPTFAISDDWLALSLNGHNAVLLRNRWTYTPWLLLPAGVDYQTTAWLVEFAPDGERLYLGAWRDGVAVWRLLSDGALLERTIGAPITSSALSSDRRYLVIYRSNQLAVWEVSTGALLAARNDLTQFPYGLQQLAVSPDGAWVAYAGPESPTVYLWRWQTDTRLTFTIPSGSVNKLIFTPDSTLLGVATSRERLLFLRASDGQPVVAFTLQGESPGNLVFSNDSKMLAIAQVNGSLIVARNPFYPDLNNDGVIDDADLLTVLLNFGASGASVQGDANYDGVVDDSDLMLVLFHFGA